MNINFIYFIPSFFSFFYNYVLWQPAIVSIVAKMLFMMLTTI